MGSGGWLNIVEKYARAKAYCDAPFEVLYRNGRKTVVHIEGEWIGETRNGSTAGPRRRTKIYRGDATEADLKANSLDAVFTDPPYFGNVQYAELMDFCYVWLRRLVSAEAGAFDKNTTRNAAELTGNVNMGRGLEHFADGMSRVFVTSAKALKPGAPFAFTFHHNKIEAYFPVAIAILDAGLTCSGSIPCPAEMGASIHISGTKSSVMDTVFVCRSTGRIPRSWIVCQVDGVARLVRTDLAALRESSIKIAQGDVRCIAFGHIIRLCIWRLRSSWDPAAPLESKLSAVRSWVHSEMPPAAVLGHLADAEDETARFGPLWTAEEEGEWRSGIDEVSF